MTVCKNCGKDKSDVKERELPNGRVSVLCRSCKNGIVKQGKEFAGSWDNID